MPDTRSETTEAVAIYHVHTPGDFPVDLFYFCCAECGNCSRHTYNIEHAAEMAVEHYKEHIHGTDA